MGKQDAAIEGMITLTGVFRLPIVALLAGLGLAAAGQVASAAPKAATARARRTNERTGRLTPAFSELVKAHRRGDRSSLGRLADKIGPARLALAIAGADEHLSEAALAAAELARGGISLSAAIAAELGSANPGRAAAAAGALGVLLDGSVPTALEDWEVPADEVALACGGLRALAAKTDAPSAARLAALDAMLSSAPSCGPPGDLTTLAHDAVPAIRRAAILVAAGARREVIAKDAVADGDRNVSAAAVAAACRFEGRRGSSGHETPPAPQVIATARLLATAQTTPTEDAVEMLDCLAASKTPADRALLDDLRRGPPSPLRDRAVELGDLAARGKGE